MQIAFYIAATVAIVSTLLVVTNRHAVHALLYFIVSLFSVAVVFLLLGAPFVAALEVIIYAGAIMVLFVFVVMLLSLGPEAAAQERSWMPPRIWMGPSLLALILGVQLVWLLARGDLVEPVGEVMVGPREVGLALWGPYVLGAEIAAMLLLAGLVGAFHLGRRERRRRGEESDRKEEAA